MEKLLFLLEQLNEKKINKKINRIKELINLLEKEFKETNSSSVEVDIYWWNKQLIEYEKELLEKKETFSYLINQIKSYFEELEKDWVYPHLSYRIFQLKTKIYNRNYKNRKNEKLKEIS